MKTAAAVIPVVVEYGKLDGRQFWRLISWIGSLSLVVYGGIYALTALLMLTSLVEPTAAYDKSVMLGHALLWDPVFFFWGLSLAISLVLTRSRARSTD